MEANDQGTKASSESQPGQGGGFNPMTIGRGMMTSEDMPRMRETMMTSVFKEMRAEDRMAFMQNMMPRCMSMMFSGLDAEARRALAEAMLQRMMNELKSQRDAATETPAAPAAEPGKE